MPAWCKILFIPALNIFVFKMPFYFAAAFLVLQFMVALYIHFTVKDFLKDFSPVIFYAVILYMYGFAARCLSAGIKDALIVFTDTQTAVMLLKLFCIMQSASLVFRTSTQLQIREGAGTVEGAFRRILPVSRQNRFSNTLSLFICFIPLVFKNWKQVKRAWYARGGRRGLKMYGKLFPVFFSVGIKQAYNAARAMAARS